jgi:hypothetical protein
MRVKNYYKVLLTIYALLIGLNFCFSQASTNSNEDRIDAIYSNSIAIKPIDLFVSIYAIQYERQFDKNNEGIIGIYYLQSQADSLYPGTYRLITPMVGYRRYLWKELHIEYVLMPGCAIYDDNSEGTRSTSFEIWNELHCGYRFQFSLLKTQMFINPQVLFGFCLYRSNQPNSFRIIDEDPENFIPNQFYIFPNINFGFRF